MTVNIEGFKLKPFPCPNCDHEIFVGRIKRTPEDDGMHDVGDVYDITGKSITQAIHDAQRTTADGHGHQSEDKDSQTQTLISSQDS